MSATCREPQCPSPSTTGTLSPERSGLLKSLTHVFSFEDTVPNGRILPYARILPLPFSPTSRNTGESYGYPRGSMAFTHSPLPFFLQLSQLTNHREFPFFL